MCRPKTVKVAFVGTHGVGKTTLVYDQAARFKREGVNVEVVMEVARRCPLPINQTTTSDAQTWILMEQIAEEIRAANSGRLVLCDRSVLDNYAYLKRAGGKVSSELEAWLCKWVQSYDLLIKVPLLGAKLQTDGVRDTNLQFASEIDALVDSLGHQFVAWDKWRWLLANRKDWDTGVHKLIREALDGCSSS